MGPYISSNQGVITWYTPAMIAVSQDGEKVAYVAERDSKRNIFTRTLRVAALLSKEPTLETIVLLLVILTIHQECALMVHFTQEFATTYLVYT